MANDTFTIQINSTTKKAIFNGVLSVQNTFNVEVFNIGSANASDLAMQIIKDGSIYAEMEAGDFSLSGSKAVGILDLDTTALTTYFSWLSDQAYAVFTLVLVDTVGLNLLVNDKVRILNNVYSG